MKLGLGRGEDTQVPAGDEGVREGRRRGKARQVRRGVCHLRRHADVGRGLRQVRNRFLIAEKKEAAAAAENCVRRSNFIYDTHGPLTS